MTAFFCPSVLLPDGWAADVRIDVAADGAIDAVTAGGSRDGSTRLAGPVVPGMPNLHSHAFQRAMAGMAEVAGPGDDSFWTWRTAMYGFVERLAPEDMQAIAAQLYVEMLKAGYTAIGEFHYLHHDRDGAPYAAPTELSDRVIAAARETGIGITHLPVLYAHGGFGGAPPGDGQRRFITDADGFLRLVDALVRRYGDDPQTAIGIAPHSLRAVTPELLDAVVTTVTAGQSDAPIHIHIAEQEKEVADCRAWSGARPVEWLLDHHDVDRRWCLVHATHMTVGETAGLADSGAVAGLCPTTEANLGDGLFPAIRFLERGGVFGIGSDSHISVDPVEELRWLEYGQRLLHRGRNLLTGGAGQSTGAALYRRALAGGAQALGRPLGAIAPGRRADLVVLDGAQPLLTGKSGDTLLDAWIFAGNVPLVRDVVVGGQTVVQAGHHPAEDTIAARYSETLQRLSN